MLFPQSTYVNRRAALRAQVGSGLILLFGNNDSPYNYPANVYKFRQDSAFLYYFGQHREGLVGVLDIDNGEEYLIGDDIEKLPYLCILARATLRTIKFSIALSMTINFVAIILSSLGLLTPITGAIVHNAGSIFVVLIAALLYDRKFIKKAEKL